MGVSHEIADYLASHPDVVVEQFAKEKDITPRDVVHALPPQMRRFADGSRFVEAMSDVATWGDVTFIVHTEDGIMEFGGTVPAGQISRGYYNIPGARGFHGHLRHDRCSEIAFLERPFMGRLSASILFFNREDNIMFKIFVGRDEARNLKSGQLEQFRLLAERIASRA